MPASMNWNGLVSLRINRNNKLVSIVLFCYKIKQLCKWEGEERAFVDKKRL